MVARAVSVGVAHVVTDRCNHKCMKEASGRRNCAGRAACRGMTGHGGALPSVVGAAIAFQRRDQLAAYFFTASGGPASLPFTRSAQSLGQRPTFCGFCDPPSLVKAYRFPDHFQRRSRALQGSASEGHGAAL